MVVVSLELAPIVVEPLVVEPLPAPCAVVEPDCVVLDVLPAAVSVLGGVPAVEPVPVAAVPEPVEAPAPVVVPVVPAAVVPAMPPVADVPADVPVPEVAPVPAVEPACAHARPKVPASAAAMRVVVNLR